MTLGQLRKAALIALLVGAVGSIGLVIRAGRNNNSRILMVLMITWVVAPYVALLLADVVSKRWPILTRQTLYVVMLVLTICSLVVYGYDVVRPRTKAAFVYVIVPGLSWLAMAMTLAISAFIAGRTRGSVR